MKRVGSLILLLLFAPGLAAPRVRTGTLTGTVVGSDGAALARARVTVQQADGRHPHAKVTDTAGRFTFSRLSVGPYDVRAYHNGVWSEWQHHVIVRTGKQTKIELRLPAAQTHK